MAMTKGSGIGREKLTTATKRKPAGKAASPTPANAPVPTFAAMQRSKAKAAQKAGIVLGKKKPMK